MIIDNALKTVLKRLAILSIIILFQSYTMLAATIEVKNTKDGLDQNSNPIAESFRAAIVAANLNPDKDKIVFNFDPEEVGPPYIIYIDPLAGPLPTIQCDLEIDGECADGDNPFIIIDGRQSISYGLKIDLGDGKFFIIQKIHIRNFVDKGIIVEYCQACTTSVIKNNIISGIYTQGSEEANSVGIGLEINSDNVEIYRNAFGTYVNDGIENNYTSIYQPATNGTAIKIIDGSLNKIGGYLPDTTGVSYGECDATKANKLAFNGSYGIDIITLEEGVGANLNIISCNTIIGCNSMAINLNVPGITNRGNNSTNAPIVLVAEDAGEYLINLRGTSDHIGGRVEVFRAGSNRIDAMEYMGYAIVGADNKWQLDYITDYFNGYVANVTRAGVETSEFWINTDGPGSTDPEPDCITTFAPIEGEKYIISAWVKEDPVAADVLSYAYSVIQINFKTSETIQQTTDFSPSGQIIDGWQRITGEFTVPYGSDKIEVNLINSSTASGEYEVFFDDIRIHPVNSSLKSFVYDAVSMKLMAELDENNYGSFYEYDEEGSLIRVEKETIRGRKTIQESYNSIRKNTAD